MRERTLLARHDTTQLHDFFKWAIDQIGANSVDSYKNPAIRAELLDSVPHLIPAFNDMRAEPLRLADQPYGFARDSTPQSTSEPATTTPEDGVADVSDSEQRGQAVTANSEGRENSGDGGTEDSSRPKRPRDTPLERYLYSTVRLNNLPLPVQRLLREAKTLAMEEKPYTACILSRVVLELTVSSPKVLAWSGAKEGQPLNAKVGAALQQLDPELGQRLQKVVRRDLIQAQMEKEGIGVQYMHQFVHNSSSTADHHLARRFSAAFTPLLNAINEAIAGRP